MTRRVYFLAPDLDSVHAIVDELKAMDVPEGHIHVIGSLCYDLDDLPRATELERTELKRGLELGIGLGGSAGLLGGLLAVTFPPAGLVLGGGAVLLTTVTGAGFGGLVAGLIGRDRPNHDLAAFEQNIANGELLVLVDAPLLRVDAIKETVLKHHPEAHIGVAHPPE